METTSAPRLGARYASAVHYALSLHEAQVRKGTRIPYASHLLAVSALVLEANGTESEAVAALLHDAAEDQGGEARLGEIRTLFGDEIARIVHDCSDSLALRKEEWMTRKLTHLERLRWVPPSSFLVALADTVHNAQTLATDLATVGPAVWTRFSAPAEDQIRILQGIRDSATARAAEEPRLRALQRRLAQAVSAIEEALDEPAEDKHQASDDPIQNRTVRRGYKASRVHPSPQT